MHEFPTNKQTHTHTVEKKTTDKIIEHHVQWLLSRVTPQGRGRGDNTTKVTGQAKMREQISSSHHSRGASWEGSTHARSSKGGWAQQHSSTHMGCPCLATLVFFFFPGHCGRHRWQRERERWGSGSSAVVHHTSCTKAFSWVCFRLASIASSPQARKGQPAFCACSASSLEARRTWPWCTRTPPQSLHP